jgi:hypothetical protein
LRHHGRLRRRQPLIDQLDAALQVEPEAGFLVLGYAGDSGDHHQRRQDQRDDEDKDEAVSLSVCHRLGVWMLVGGLRARWRNC